MDNYIVVFENRVQDRYYGPFKTALRAEAFAEEMVLKGQYAFYSIHALRAV